MEDEKQINYLFDKREKMLEDIFSHLENKIKNNTNLEEKNKYKNILNSLKNNNLLFLELSYIVGINILMEIGYDQNTSVEYINFLGDVNNYETIHQKK